MIIISTVDMVRERKIEERSWVIQEWSPVPHNFSVVEKDSYVLVLNSAPIPNKRSNAPHSRIKDIGGFFIFMNFF
jgi:hypothetical protein